MIHETNYQDNNFTKKYNSEQDGAEEFEIPKKKHTKMEQMNKKISNSTIVEDDKMKEQQKQVLKEIRHLASQGSQMQESIYNFIMDTINCGFMQFFNSIIFTLYYIYFVSLFILAQDTQNCQSIKYKAIKNLIKMMLQQMKCFQSKNYPLSLLFIYTHIYIFLPPNSITPIIFTKKLPSGGSYRQKSSQPIWLSAFENLLTVVVQLYYKSDQKIAEFMKDKVTLDSKKDVKPEKRQRPGRKKKPQITSETNFESNNQDDMGSQGNGPTYGQLQQDVLEILISPLRSDFPFGNEICSILSLEKWTTKEIAIFECGICRFGKQYEFIANMIKSKSAQDIIQFYYSWKFSSHYKLWKIHKAYYHRSNLNNYV